MLRCSVPCAADPDVAWELLSHPDRWHEWAPHLRGAWGLGDGEVQGSALGAARLLGILPVPARIELVEHSATRRHWVWKVGVVHFDHEVRSTPTGCAITLTCRAPGAIERAIALTYWPLVRVLTARLARVAEARSDRRSTVDGHGEPGPGLRSASPARAD